MCRRSETSCACPGGRGFERLTREWSMLLCFARGELRWCGTESARPPPPSCVGVGFFFLIFSRRCLGIPHKKNRRTLQTGHSTPGGVRDIYPHASRWLRLPPPTPSLPRPIPPRLPAVRFFVSFPSRSDVRKTSERWMQLHLCFLQFQTLPLLITRAEAKDEPDLQSCSRQDEGAPRFSLFAKKCNKLKREARASVWGGRRRTNGNGTHMPKMLNAIVKPAYDAFYRAFLQVRQNRTREKGGEYTHTHTHTRTIACTESHNHTRCKVLRCHCSYVVLGASSSVSYDDGLRGHKDHVSGDAEIRMCEAAKISACPDM